MLSLIPSFEFRLRIITLNKWSYKLLVVTVLHNLISNLNNLISNYRRYGCHVSVITFSGIQVLLCTSEDENPFVKKKTIKSREIYDIYEDYIIFINLYSTKIIFKIKDMQLKSRHKHDTVEFSVPCRM